MVDFNDQNTFMKKYFSSESTNFWVAETEAATGKSAEIVGTVAVTLPEKFNQDLLGSEDTKQSLQLVVSTVYDIARYINGTKICFPYES